MLVNKKITAGDEPAVGVGHVVVPGFDPAVDGTGERGEDLGLDEEDERPD